MAIFTPDRAFVSLADLIARELARTKPLGVGAFARTFEYSRLLGVCANFIGSGSDSGTQLNISYIRPEDPRATDALSCRITRGNKTIFVSDYLTHEGHDPRFMSNNQRQPSDTFLVAAIEKLGGLSKFSDLVLPLAGGEMVKIPFDWGGTR